LKDNWSIRTGLQADLGALSAIDTLASAYPWTEQQLLPACKEGEGHERSLVIDDNNLLAGFVVYQAVLDEGSIHNIAVRPEHQRRGLARALVLATLDAMEKQCVTRVWLEVRESNDAARALYSALNFQLDGKRKNYYRSADGREDALLMSKPLGA
jgi:ribosomal-protein-alanine N-acetyltransferase